MQFIVCILRTWEFNLSLQESGISISIIPVTARQQRIIILTLLNISGLWCSQQMELNNPDTM